MRHCPRLDCTNTLHAPELIVCTGDFHALAGMCRGKKRLGEPEAAEIQWRTGATAYRCPLCKQQHNGNSVRCRWEMVAIGRDTVRALTGDERVGWRGVLNLAQAWRPELCERSRWAEGLDQTVAYA